MPEPRLKGQMRDIITVILKEGVISKFCLANVLFLPSDGHLHYIWSSPQTRNIDLMLI